MIRLKLRLPSYLPTVTRCKCTPNKRKLAKLQRKTFHGRAANLQTPQLQGHQLLRASQPSAHRSENLVGGSRLHFVVLDNAMAGESARHGRVQVEPSDAAGGRQVVTLLAAGRRRGLVGEHGAQETEVEVGIVGEVADWPGLRVF